MYRFRTVSIIFAILVIINNSIAQNELLDCSKMSDNVLYENPAELDLTYNGEIRSFKQLNFTRIISTSNVKNNNNLKKTYIDAILTDGGNISVFTTDDFTTYAQEETDTTIRLKVEYECANGFNKSWLFYQEIKPGNYFAPVFSQDEYHFKVPLPLYRGLNIADFLAISAHDDDLVNNTVSFSSPDAENYMIQVETSNLVGLDKKTFNAILKLMKILLSITEQIEFTIIATDIGVPPRSTNATVSIIRDIENSLPPQPQFTKFIYNGQLDTYLNLESMEPVILRESTFSELVTFDKSGNDADLFLIESQLNEINLQLSRTLTDDDIIGKTYFQFNIIAANSQLNETGISGVIIDIPAKNQEIAANFAKTLYIGKINDSQLSLEEIRLDVAIEIGEIEFSLENSDSIYFDMKVDENIIHLTLKPDIDQNQWAIKSFLTVTVLAVFQNEIIAKTDVIIEIPKITQNLNFQFKQILYAGNLTINNKIDLEKILIESDDSTVLNRLNIHLEGNDSNLFKFEFVTNEVLLSLKDDISEESWNGKSILTLQIIATDPIESTIAATGVIIEVKNHLSGQSTHFEQTLYTGKINGLSLSLENIHLETAIMETINFSLQNPDAFYFNMNINENDIQLILKPDIDENQWTNKSFLSVQILASFGKEILATTEVIIEIQINQESLNFKFEKIMYVGKLETNTRIDLETIRIKSDDSIILNRLVINLEGMDSNLFKFELKTNEVLLSLKDDISEESWRGKLILSLRIIATDPLDSKIAATGVVIEITSNEPTPCPQPEQCPTTEPPTDIPIFEKDLYIFSEKPNYIGTIAAVSASIPNLSASITYKTLVTNEHLISRISIDAISGELSLTSIVSPGIYIFQVIAINNANNSKGTSTIRLEIDSIIQCGNRTFVGNSLIIKRLEEMKIHNDVMKATYEGCVFEIFDEFPKTETKFFSIDQTTKMIVSNIFNREDAIFSNMIKPQIQLKLKLICPEIVINEMNNDLILKRNRRDISENNEILMMNNESLILTDDIPFTIDETLLTIIIVDINDNYPQFTYPPKDNVIIGYPDKEITSDLLPEFLTKIQAFDIDEGINATIFYKIKNNEHFTIDSSTGIIYPFKNAMNLIDTLTLEIYATDRNGSNDGLTNTTKLIVKKLLSNQIILLTFEVNRFDENIDNLLMKIENKINLQLIPIKHAIVPNNENFLKIALRLFKQITPNTDEFILKVWAYAFDENDKPIETSIIKTKLSSIEAELKLTVEAYEDAKKSEILNGNLSATGYIIAVSLLSIISFVCIGFIVWWFYIKNHKFNKPISMSSSTIGTPFMAKLQTDLEYKKNIGDGTDYGPELSHYQKRESVKIFGITSNETSDENQQKKLSDKQISISEQSRTSDSANESSSVKSDNNSIGDDKPNKTTVTFNEMVERIDIESEDETHLNNWEATSKF